MAPKRSSHEDDDDEEESSSEDLTPQPKPKPHSGSDSEPEETPRSLPEPVATRSKSKPSPKAPTPATAKRPTVRVWSEEEEISILKGLIDYEQKIGFNPSSDMEAFHAFVKKSLHAEASRSQLHDKVRRLKRKYRDNVEKLKKDESVRSSWKTHDKKLFDLSKKMWGSEDNDMHSEKTRSVRIANQSSSLPPIELEMSPAVDPAKDIQEMECEKNLTKDRLPDKKLKLGNGDVESYVMGKGLDLIEGQQRAELEERWANLHKAELEVFVERTKLILDQAKLVLAANK